MKLVKIVRIISITFLIGLLILLAFEMRQTEIQAERIYLLAALVFVGLFLTIVNRHLQQRAKTKTKTKTKNLQELQK